LLVAVRHNGEARIDVGRLFGVPAAEITPGNAGAGERYEENRRATKYALRARFARPPSPLVSGAKAFAPLTVAPHSPSNPQRQTAIEAIFERRAAAHRNQQTRRRA